MDLKRHAARSMPRFLSGRQGRRRDAARIVSHRVV
jgi:hypothetical protein